jgi:hypothetical protein
MDMVYDRTYIQEYLERFVHPKSRTLERSLLAVFDVLSSGSEVLREDLDATAQGASDKRANIYHVSTEFQGEIAEKDERAMLLIREMSDAKLAHIRHNALLCLNSEIPTHESLSIIRKSLADKSSRVRIKASDWAYRLNLRMLVPDLKAALRIESDEEVAEEIRYSLRELTKKSKSNN